MNIEVEAAMLNSKLAALQIVVDNLESEIDAALMALDSVKKENERYRKALEFYAATHNWQFTESTDNDYYETLPDDCEFFDSHNTGLYGGKRARAALRNKS